MRKRIGVFLGEIGREFQKEFAKYIRKVACGKGYDVFIFNNFGSYTSTFLYDSGERDIVKIPDFSKFDGIISLADTFDIDGMESDLLLRIQEQSDCPVVSVRNGSADTYRIFFDDYKTIYEMTNHFIKKHGYRNICFMSGPFDLPDSQERMNGFKDAMKDSGIMIPDDAIHEGDFWKFQSKPAADRFLSCYNGNTQAIVCANDYMALGLIEELTRRGIKIPQDIAISGFDNIVEGQICNPSLTSVKLPVDQMAERALSIIERVNGGDFVLKDNFITGKIITKNSCGCRCCEPPVDTTYLINQVADEYVNIRLSTALISDISNHITEEEKLRYINFYFKHFNFVRNYLCLCTDQKKDDETFSDEVILRASFPLPTESGLLNIAFDRSYIIPEEAYDSETPTCFLVIPIHHKEKTYGYSVMEWSDTVDYTRFIAPYTEALALAYDDLSLQKQFGELVEIRKQNLIDALTGANNRRGLEHELTNLKSDPNLKKYTLTFISADMDNLKMINDTYGHSEGDTAIISFSKALREVIKDNGFFARTGGDEFTAVLVSENSKAAKSFKDDLTYELDRIARETQMEYPLHASIGLVTTDSTGIESFSDNIKKADSKMYKAKKEYKKKYQK